MELFNNEQINQLRKKFKLLEKKSIAAQNTFSSLLSKIKHPFEAAILDPILGGEKHKQWQMFSYYLEQLNKILTACASQKNNAKYKSTYEMVIAAINEVVEDKRELDIEGKINLQLFLLQELLKDDIVQLLTKHQSNLSQLKYNINTTLKSVVEDHGNFTHKTINAEKFKNLFKKSYLKKPHKRRSSQPSIQVVHSNIHSTENIALAVNTPATLSKFIAEYVEYQKNFPSQNSTENTATVNQPSPADRIITVFFQKDFAWTEKKHADASYLLPLLQYYGLSSLAANTDEIYISDIVTTTQKAIEISYTSNIVRHPQTISITQDEYQKIGAMFGSTTAIGHTLLLPTIRTRYGIFRMDRQGVKHPLNDCIRVMKENIGSLNVKTAPSACRQALQRLKDVCNASSPTIDEILSASRDLMAVYWKKNKKPDALFNDIRNYQNTLYTYSAYGNEYTLLDQLKKYQVNRFGLVKKLFFTKKTRKSQLQSVYDAINDFLTEAKRNNGALDKLVMLDKLGKVCQEISQNNTHSQLVKILQSYIEQQQSNNRTLLIRWFKQNNAMAEILPLWIGKSTSIEKLSAAHLSLLFGEQDREKIKSIFTQHLLQWSADCPRVAMAKKMAQHWFAPEATLQNLLISKECISPMLMQKKLDVALVSLHHIAEYPLLVNACNEIVKFSDNQTDNFLWLLVGALTILKRHENNPDFDNRLIFKMLSRGYEYIQQKINTFGNEEPLLFVYHTKQFFDHPAVKQLNLHLQYWNTHKKNNATDFQTISHKFTCIDVAIHKGYQNYFNAIKNGLLNPQPSATVQQEAEKIRKGDFKLVVDSWDLTEHNTVLKSTTKEYSAANVILCENTAFSQLVDQLAGIKVDISHLQNLKEARQWLSNVPATPALKKMAQEYLQLFLQILLPTADKNFTQEQVQQAKEILQEILQGKPLFTFYNGTQQGESVGTKQQFIEVIIAAIVNSTTSAVSPETRNHNFLSPEQQAKALINHPFLLHYIPEQRENFIKAFENSIQGIKLFEEFANDFIEAQKKGKLENPHYLSNDLAKDFACFFSVDTITQLKQLDPAKKLSAEQTVPIVLSEAETLRQEKYKELRSALNLLPSFYQKIYRQFLDCVSLCQEKYHAIEEEVKSNQNILQSTIIARMDETDQFFMNQKLGHVDYAANYLREIYPTSWLLDFVLTTRLCKGITSENKQIFIEEFNTLIHKLPTTLKALSIMLKDPAVAEDAKQMLQQKIMLGFKLLLQQIGISQIVTDKDRQELMAKLQEKLTPYTTNGGEEINKCASAIGEIINILMQDRLQAEKEINTALIQLTEKEQKEGRIEKLKNMKALTSKKTILTLHYLIGIPKMISRSVPSHPSKLKQDLAELSSSYSDELQTSSVAKKTINIEEFFASTESILSKIALYIRTALNDNVKIGQESGFLPHSMEEAFNEEEALFIFSLEDEHQTMVLHQKLQTTNKFSAQEKLSFHAKLITDVLCAEINPYFIKFLTATPEAENSYAQELAGMVAIEMLQRVWEEKISLNSAITGLQKLFDKSTPEALWTLLPAALAAMPLSQKQYCQQQLIKLLPTVPQDKLIIVDEALQKTPAATTSSEIKTSSAGSGFFHFAKNTAKGVGRNLEQALSPKKQRKHEKVEREATLTLLFKSHPEIPEVAFNFVPADYLFYAHLCDAVGLVCEKSKLLIYPLLMLNEEQMMDFIKNIQNDATSVEHQYFSEIVKLSGSEKTLLVNRLTKLKDKLSMQQDFNTEINKLLTQLLEQLRTGKVEASVLSSPKKSPHSSYIPKRIKFKDEHPSDKPKVLNFS